VAQERKRERGGLEHEKRGGGHGTRKEEVTCQLGKRENKSPQGKARQ